MTPQENYELLAQLGLLEGVKAGALQASAAANAAITALTLITTPDATDEATAITLVNDCKNHINAIIDALKTA